MKTEVPKVGISVHADSFSILSELSVAISHLQRNDLFAQAQALEVLMRLERKIADGNPTAFV